MVRRTKIASAAATAGCRSFVHEGEQLWQSLTTLHSYRYMVVKSTSASSLWCTQINTSSLTGDGAASQSCPRPTHLAMTMSHALSHASSVFSRSRLVMPIRNPLILPGLLTPLPASTFIPLLTDFRRPRSPCFSALALSGAAPAVQSSRRRMVPAPLVRDTETSPVGRAGAICCQIYIISSMSMKDGLATHVDLSLAYYRIPAKGVMFWRIS
jgi:hypothetical protein